MTQIAPNAKLTSTVLRQYDIVNNQDLREYVLNRFIKIKVPMKPALTWKPFRSAENKAGRTTARILEVQLIVPSHRWSHLGRMFQTLNTNAIALKVLVGLQDN